MFFSFDKSIGFSFLFKFKQQMQNAPGFDGNVQSNMNTEKKKKGLIFHPLRGKNFVLTTLYTVDKSKIFHVDGVPKLKVLS